MSAYIYFALKRKHYGVIIFHVELAAGRMLTHALRVAFWLCQFLFSQMEQFHRQVECFASSNECFKIFGNGETILSKMTNGKHDTFSLSLITFFCCCRFKEILQLIFFSLEKQFKHCKSISHGRLTDTCAHFFDHFLFSNTHFRLLDVANT